ncbi:MAG: FGGY family carbohydrate kinase [Cyanobacteria bacterium]|nr:FGGY family carbohydrate kinase [Cyanobacteriota bacterium]MDA1020448.1 FGGY family carbohydrate kinase [Cyanobacteriota bacterium]
MDYVLTIDEGTTSTRALLIDAQGKILDIVQKEITQYYPQPGWVEHDASEIWDKTLACCRELIKQNLDACKINKDSIKSIAITNQRETTVVWDPRSGKPVHKAIVWQCRRTSDRCKELSKTKIGNIDFTDYIKAKTGLIPDAYFSATKLEWILNNRQTNAEAGQSCPLLFGTIDTWLLWNLTLGRAHLTEPSNASRTMLYDINENKWDEEILKTLKIDKLMLPDVIDSNGNFNSSPLFQDLLDQELPIKAVLGDQQAALYAYDNQAKCTYGTGTFVMIPYRKGLAKMGDTAQSKSRIGNERDSMSFSLATNNDGLLKSAAYKTETAQAFALEGSIFIGGSIVQWLRDELQFIEKSADIEALANEVSDNGGVYLIPALAGLGAPFWKGDARGTIFGITRGSNKAHIARAAIESIAYRVRDIFEALDPELRKSITQLNVDGGASLNDTLMQFQADLLQIPIQRYTETEMTALGVAKMTGEIELELKADKVFEPGPNLDAQYQVWKNYLSKLL